MIACRCHWAWETLAEAKLCCRCHFTSDQWSFVDVVYQRQSGCRACFLSGLCTQRSPCAAVTGCCQCCWCSVCVYCPRQCSGIQSPGGTGVRNCDYIPLEGWLFMSSSFSGLWPISESRRPDITYTDWRGIKMLSHTDCRQWKLWIKCKLEQMCCPYTSYRYNFTLGARLAVTVYEGGTKNSSYYK